MNINKLNHLITEELNSVINEIGESNLSPYSWTKNVKSIKGHNYQYDYYFTTEDDDQYRVQIYYDTVNQNWSVSFFANEDEFDTDDTDIFTNVVNKGKLFKVMATVSSTVKDFIDIVGPKEIEIIPVKNEDVDKRRFNLYLQYVKKNVPEGYRILVKNYGEHPKVFLIKKSINEEDDSYHMSHRPASKEYGAPMYDLTDTYPDDIYSDKAVRYYGDNAPYDAYSIHIIQSARNKPDMPVKIYRAIPKVLTPQQKLDYYIKHQKYILKTGKLPPNVTNWPNKDEYYNYLDNEINKLETEINNNPEAALEKIKINPGDWITINPAYAKEHGQHALKGQYRVISKTVTAKNLFTDGNSIHEWGYDI